MDQVKLAKRPAVRLDLEDPIWAVKALAEDVNKETITQIQKMLTEQLDQISAANVQAENAAKARGEALISQGSEWAAKKIREAGEAAAARFNTEVEKAQADAKKDLVRAAAAVWIAAGMAGAAALGAFAVLWL
jgi:hypothetical protein